MTRQHEAVVWIEARGDYSRDEIAALSGLPRAVIDDLVECGVLPGGDSVRPHFEAEAIVLARAAGRLRDHFELDGAGLAVALSLLRRVRTLESALAAAHARAPGRDDRHRD